MKKKGLIISTVVMVIVLIASLGTATYAWFSSTATAAVDSMTINSTASKGITISAYDGAKWYNGDLALPTDDATKPAAGRVTKWSGATEGQGANLKFDTAPMEFFGVSGDGMNMLTAGEKSGSVKGTKAENLYKATENYDYFAAVIAIQNTETTGVAKNITAEIKFNANGPMAAAARIGVFAFNGSGNPDADAMIDAAQWTEKFVLAPFGKAVKAGATWGNSGNTADTYLKVVDGKTADYATALKNEAANITTGKFTNLIVDENAFATGTDLTNSMTDATKVVEKVSLGTVTNQLDLIYLRLVIWFEGEDPQCEASNAGTGLTISINFVKEA